jgi:hypothetical protein
VSTYDPRFSARVDERLDAGDNLSRAIETAADEYAMRVQGKSEGERLIQRLLTGAVPHESGCTRRHDPYTSDCQT